MRRWWAKRVKLWDTWLSLRGAKAKLRDISFRDSNGGYVSKMEREGAESWLRGATFSYRRARGQRPYDQAN